MFSHSLESRASAKVMVAWVNKCHCDKHLPFLLLYSDFYYWPWHHFPFDQYWSAVLAMSPPSLLPSPSWAWVLIVRKRQCRVGKRKCLDAVQALYNNSENGCVIDTNLVTNIKHSTVEASMKKVNSIPVSPSTFFLCEMLRCYFMEICFLTWRCCLQIFSVPVHKLGSLPNHRY